MMGMQDKILSISEAARYLGVFPLTLRNWEKKGMLKAFRTLGGHRRFKKSELDKIINSKTPNKPS
jgi:putative resolvase